jgi:hypothetical protein
MKKKAIIQLQRRFASQNLHTFVPFLFIGGGYDVWN